MLKGFIAYKVDSYGGHKVVSEDIILLGKFRHRLYWGNISKGLLTYSESEKERWFTDTRVSNKEHLEEIVAIKEGEVLKDLDYAYALVMIVSTYYSGFIFLILFSILKL